MGNSAELDAALKKVGDTVATSAMPDVYWRVWVDPYDDKITRGELDGWQYGKPQFLTYTGSPADVADALISKLREWRK